MFPVFKEEISIGELKLKFLFDGQDTDGTLVVFEMLVPPNIKVPAPHYHVDVDETLHVMEGTLHQIYGDEIRVLNPGDTLFIKRGIVHGFNNTGTVPTRVLCSLSQASIGPEYFRAIAEIINAGGPPDMQRILGVMKQFGLEVK
ncbi:cupin domain-containing protein [Taibaiella soli]|uniref:Cupin domain-containing protein n=1 Tax=Taibaiella soli TaxID=1649169 RepID=A0A2W2BXQ2_9BACT|nr:cupin domain-containing protein [Taibaiella soli]PZF72633.1 cupin domain-containing protein [Taibaiella soli]